MQSAAPLYREVWRSGKSLREGASVAGSKLKKIRFLCDICQVPKSYKGKEDKERMDEADLLFEKYYEDVFRFLRGITANEHLAEELTQETIYRALKSIGTYRGETDMRVWMCSIARNLYYTHYKRQKRFVPADDLEMYETEGGNMVEMIADKEMALQIHKVLHQLREPYKEIFSLRIFGELSFREIGGLFDKSEHWACVTYHRAKEMVQAGVLAAQGEGMSDAR